MSLLSELLSMNETISAAGIAAVPGGKLMPLTKREKLALARKLKGVTRLRGLGESREDAIDVLDVQSKLDASDKQSRYKRADTAVFGLLDDDDKVVRVTILKKDAVEFEKVLSLMLGKLEGDVNSVEIAEVIFKLKDKFEIVDVNWGVVEADEEEEEDGELGDDSDEDMDADADPEGEVGDGSEGDIDPDGMDDTTGDDSEGEVKSALSAVIDMMKADAEARKAEAEADAAKYSAEAAKAKIAQEEELADMNEYNKKKKEAETEAKKIAQLAQYKHDLENDEAPADTDTDDMDAEEEEVVVVKKRKPKAKKISKVDLATAILKHLK